MESLKSVITRYSSLEEFVDKSFLILGPNVTTKQPFVQKVPVVFHSKDYAASLNYKLVSNAIIDENVDVHLIRKHFMGDARMQVTGVIEKCSNPVYICKSCSHDLNESTSIICDHCLTWFHIQCVGLKQSPKARYWFCLGCHESPSMYFSAFIHSF